MSERPSFFAELKRRNVYKVAVAYVVVAWLLLQAASIFLPAFDSPSWVMKFLIVVIILGFPVVLILSWAFELTSEGIKLESEIAPNQSITRRTGRKIVGITIMLAVFAAGLMIFQIVRPKPSAISERTGPPSLEPPIESKSIALAVIHLALGENEEALRLLEKSLDERSIFLQGDFGSLKTDKRLDPLRRDPRFKNLERRFMTGQPE